MWTGTKNSLWTNRPQTSFQELDWVHYISYKWRIDLDLWISLKNCIWSAEIVNNEMKVDFFLKLCHFHGIFSSNFNQKNLKLQMSVIYLRCSFYFFALIKTLKKLTILSCYSKTWYLGAWVRLFCTLQFSKDHHCNSPNGWFS